MHKNYKAALAAYLATTNYYHRNVTHNERIRHIMNFGSTWACFWAELCDDTNEAFYDTKRFFIKFFL